MENKAIKQGDKIRPSPSGMHTHFMIVPPSPAQVPTLYPDPVCDWTITRGVSKNVLLHGEGAATEGSGGVLRHDPIPRNGTFAIPKIMRECEATITLGSSKVFINGKPAASVQQQPCCRTGNEPVSDLSGEVVSVGDCRVYIG